MEDPSERMKALEGLLRAVYNDIAQALLDLPISIQIPRLGWEERDQPTAMAALGRAFALLADEPIADVEQAALEDAVREWHVAHDVLWAARRGEFSGLAAGIIETALDLAEFNLQQVRSRREGGDGPQ